LEKPYTPSDITTSTAADPVTTSRDRCIIFLISPIKSDLSFFDKISVMDGMQRGDIEYSLDIRHDDAILFLITVSKGIPLPLNFTQDHIAIIERIRNEGREPAAKIYRSKDNKLLTIVIGREEQLSSLNDILRKENGEEILTIRKATSDYIG
jgi:hypothetical protein